MVSQSDTLKHLIGNPDLFATAKGIAEVAWITNLGSSFPACDPKQAPIREVNN
jgi:hypothetical protein